MRRIFINHKASRELVSTTYKKKTLQLKSKTNSKKKILGKGLDRYFSKENIQTANKHMKRCSYNLSLDKLNQKRYHHTHLNTCFQKDGSYQVLVSMGRMLTVSLRCCEMVKRQPLWKIICQSLSFLFFFFFGIQSKRLNWEGAPRRRVRVPRWLHHVVHSLGLYGNLATLKT